MCNLSMITPRKDIFFVRSGYLLVEILVPEDICAFPSAGKKINKFSSLFCW